MVGVAEAGLQQGVLCLTSTKLLLALYEVARQDRDPLS